MAVFCAALISAVIIHVSIGGLIFETPDKEETSRINGPEDHEETSSSEELYLDLPRISTAGSWIPQPDIISSDFRGRDSASDEINVRRRETQAVKAAVTHFISSVAEAFSTIAAIPIAVAISLVNKVSQTTNHTLHVGGELTKLPVTITQSVIEELSNVTFPNK